jgi:dTDP-4-dehydrorhamnose reductase
MDLQGGGNNMVQQLTDQHRQQGHINASELWTPAASLMSDTAAVTWGLLERGVQGIHHLDSNAESALNFVELVTMLAKALNHDWKIHPNQDYKHDQRLVDPRVNMPSLKERLIGRNTWNKPNTIQNEPHS